MKKILKTLVILSAGMLTTGVVFGKFASKSPAEVQFQKGGFNGKGVNSVIRTVEQVKKMWDDSRATVRGKIVEQISKDKYRFRDSSGEMVVEIDSKYWGGRER